MVPSSFPIPTGELAKQDEKVQKQQAAPHHHTPMGLQAWPLVAARAGQRAAVPDPNPDLDPKMGLVSVELLPSEGVAKLADVMVRHGVKKGGHVVIYMPMIPQSILYTGLDMFLFPQVVILTEKKSFHKHNVISVSVPSDHPFYMLNTAGTTGLPMGKPVGMPDAGAYLRVLAEHEFAALFTSLTAIRAIRQQDPEAALGKQYSLKSNASIQTWRD
ncbi:Acyl-CoA synthetase short-chain family member 3, mitochondrial isoform X2 [Aix galericulata]|nr:Acyl-CoA synthetase short-chain family member 3, mitochondrial isoform X2 [Aix galericulata]